MPSPTSGFIGPYALGYLKDLTGTFTAGLIATGIVVACCGSLVLRLPSPEEASSRGPAHES